MSSYMYNPLFKTTPGAWVKNVYSLRTANSIVCVEPLISYTPITPALANICVQPSIYTQLKTTLLSVLSTQKMAISYLLKRYLYTVSTAPTITRTKENKERNS